MLPYSKYLNEMAFLLSIGAHFPYRIVAINAAVYAACWTSPLPWAMRSLPATRALCGD